MVASVNLVRFYYPDASVLPVKVWVMDGEMPYPEWPDADVVFVLNPPPLDIPLLADVWKSGRTLVLVSARGDSTPTQSGLHPLSELLSLPHDATGEVLMQLRRRQSSAFFMSFQPRRPWYLSWLPQVERDAFPVEGDPLYLPF